MNQVILSQHHAASMKTRKPTLRKQGQELQKRVAVPGGITAEGLRLLEDELKDVFSKLIRITHAKYYEDVAKTEAAFQAVSPQIRDHT